MSSGEKYRTRIHECTQIYTSRIDFICDSWIRNCLKSTFRRKNREIFEVQFVMCDEGISIQRYF
ncbi:MAG: hypothetical protein G01um101433_812, partial [Parcubacteria group bacterium Gr01-1014_33]